MEVCTKKVDVVIIGAGISGLSAAYRLNNASNKSLNIIILEAKDRIGGRVYHETLPAASGQDQWDLGGQWVSSSQTYVMDLLEEFGLKTYPQFTDGRKMTIMKSFNDVRSYSGLYPALGIFELVDLDRTIKKIDSFVAEIEPGDPLLCKHAADWDRMTLLNFCERHCMFAATTETIACAMRVVFGVELHQMSFFYFLYYCALAGGVMRLIDSNPGDAQQFKVVGVTSQLAYKLQANLGSEMLKKGDPVVHINQTGDDAVIVSTQSGISYETKLVICTIPPHLVNQIKFEPRLPSDRQQLGMRSSVGCMIKCIITYRTCFWRTNGQSGEGTIYADDHTIGPLSCTFDATTTHGNPAIVAFIGGEHAIYWTEKTQDERKEVVLQSLVAMFGEQSRTELVHYADKDWCKEPYNGGCPVDVMQPGCLSYYHETMRRPFDRVYWAGTETAQMWMGYIDGAIESGYREADKVYYRLSSDRGNVKSRLTANEPSILFSKTRVNSDRCSLGYVTSRVFFVCAMAGCGYFLYRTLSKK